MTEKEALLEKSKRLSIHRNICLLAGIVILYYAYQLITEAAPIGFVLVMGLFFACIAASGVWAHKRIKALDSEIKALDQQDKQ